MRKIKNLPYEAIAFFLIIIGIAVFVILSSSADIINASDETEVMKYTEPAIIQIVSRNRTETTEFYADDLYSLSLGTKNVTDYDTYAEPPTTGTTEMPEPEWISLGEYILTAYCPCVKCCEIWSAEHPSRKGTNYIQKTASGTIPKAGRTIGADPKTIPYGTVILINGNEYTVEDTGSAARGKKLIDIFHATHQEALVFGRQKAEIFIKNINY